MIQYVEGAEGVRRWKAKYPETRGIQVKTTTIAFQPKPEGYADFLCELVDRWFLSDIALSETNRADVERLNHAVHPRRFNPDNHFTKPLSATLTGKLAKVFAKHDAHLDAREVLSMSKVRAAVKAAKGKRSAGKPFGNIGHVAGDQLIAGNQSFRIEEHNGHDCIRIMVNGSRVRLRLDALAEFMDLAGLGGPPSLYSISERIGEPAPIPEKDPEPDPLADILPESRPQLVFQPAYLLSGDPAPKADEPPSLNDRIAALRPVPQPQFTACADDDDPLNHV